MKTFILLATLSPQGLQTLRFTPERLLEVNREIEDLGGRVLQQWAVLGYYDFISVIEAPDEEAAGNMVAELSAPRLGVAQGAGREHEHPVALGGRGDEEIALGAPEGARHLIAHVEDVGLVGGLWHVFSSRAGRVDRW